MKEMDLMYAMTDLDDELLERDSGAKVRRFRATKVVAFAAALALMTVTVFAAVVGINYRAGYDGEYFNNFEFSFPYEKVTIRQEAFEEMTEKLSQDWVDWYCDDYIDLCKEGNEYGPNYLGTSGPESMQNLKSMEELEAYLGLDLVTSPEIDTLVNDFLTGDLTEEPSINVLMRGPTWEEAYAEYEATGSVSLLGLEIDLSLNEANVNDYKTLKINIPLSEKYIEYYPTVIRGVLTWEGEYYGKEYSNGDREFVIAKRDFTEDYGGNCMALYTEGGIGYYLYCAIWPTNPAKSTVGPVQDPELGIFTDAEEIVLPLIENIK